MPRRWRETFKQAGYDYLIDQNGAFRDGYFPITISNLYERRVSAAIGYLDPGTRLRENLTISTNTQATGLLFDGMRCVGVQRHGRRAATGVPRAGDHPVVRRDPLARRTCCAPASARPGICASAGSRCAPTCRASASGCRTIPAVAVAAFLKPHARILQDWSRRHIYLALRYSSGLPDIPAGDMLTVITNKTSWHAVGEQIGSFIITVYKTYSETGQVRLASADWRDEPEVDFSLLSDRARPGAADGRGAPLRRHAPDARPCRR